MSQTPSSPSRSTLLFSIIVFLSVTLGVALQQRFALPGLVSVHLIFLLLPVAMALFIDHQSLRQVFRLRLLSLSGTARSVLLGLLGGGLAYLLGILMLFLVTSLGGEMPESYRLYTESDYLTAILAGALLPTLSEEFLFRGYILSNLQPMGGRLAVLFTGLLFGALHLSLVRLVPLTALGLLFAMAVQRSGSIMPSLIMHFLNNATVLSLTFLLKNSEHPLTDAVATSLPAAGLVLVAAVLLGVSAYALALTFSPADLRRPEEIPAPPVLPRPYRLLSLIWLIPGGLIYIWAVLGELFVVFVRR